MASLISKKKGNKLYYYVVESARVDGQPRIVQQTYLGTGREGGRPAEGPDGAGSSVGVTLRVRSAGRVMAGRSAFRNVGSVEIDVAQAEVRSFTCALFVVGRHTPHLSARAQDRSCGLVPRNDFADSVAVSAGSVQFAGFLGLL